MATLYKERKYYYISIPPGQSPDGKRHRKSTRTTDIRVARQRMQEYLTRVTRHELDPSQKISISDFAQKYLEDSKISKSKKTFIAEKSTVLRFTNFLKVKRIDQISPSVIEGFLKIRRETSPVAADKDHNILKTFFNSAKRLGYIYKNPVDAIKRIKPKREKLPVCYTEEEIKRLLKAGIKIGKWVYNIIATLVYTGIRVGELTHLEWNDIDLKNKLLHIQAKDGWRPKDHEIRTIPLTDSLVKIFKEIPSRQKLVFTMPNGTPIDIDNFRRRYFNKAMKSAGINRGNLHSLRHTFGSWLAARTKNILKIQKLMGHSDIKTTMIYLHFVPDEDENPMSLFPAL